MAILWILACQECQSRVAGQLLQAGNLFSLPDFFAADG